VFTRLSAVRGPSRSSRPVVGGRVGVNRVARVRSGSQSAARIEISETSVLRGIAVSNVGLRITYFAVDPVNVLCLGGLTMLRVSLRAAIPTAGCSCGTSSWSIFVQPNNGRENGQRLTTPINSCPQSVSTGVEVELPKGRRL
jgi:hypothetical protein